MTAIEDQLRAMFHTDAQRIGHDDLRAPATFPPRRARRTTRWHATATVLAAVAVTTTILAGPRLLDRSPSAGSAAAPVTAASPAAGPTADSAAVAAGAAAPLTVTFKDENVTVSPPGVPVAVPTATAYATDSQAATRVAEVINQNVTELITAFQDRADDNLALGMDPQQMSETITVADTVTWRHYLSVRFDSSMTIGDSDPLDESVALTFDTGTGNRVRTTDLFIDINAASAAVREALLTSRTDSSLAGVDLSGLSLRPSEDGGTEPLTCYPASSGLRCLVDPGSVAPYPVGRIEATVPWPRLTTLLHSGDAG